MNFRKLNHFHHEEGFTRIAPETSFGKTLDAPLSHRQEPDRARRDLPDCLDVRPGNLQRAGHSSHARKRTARRLQRHAVDHERVHHRLHHGIDGRRHAGRPLRPQAHPAGGRGAVRPHLAGVRPRAERVGAHFQPLPAGPERRRDADLPARRALAPVPGRQGAQQGLRHLGRGLRHGAGLRADHRRRDRRAVELAVGVPGPRAAGRAGTRARAGQRGRVPATPTRSASISRASSRCRSRCWG